MAESKYLDKEGLERVWSRIKTGISWTNIKDKPSWIGSSKPSYSWNEIASKPSSFPPSSHNHDGLYYPMKIVNKTIEIKKNTDGTSQQIVEYIDKEELDIGIITLLTVNGILTKPVGAIALISLEVHLPRNGSFFTPKAIETNVGDQDFLIGGYMENGEFIDKISLSAFVYENRFSHTYTLLRLE